MPYTTQTLQDFNDEINAFNALDTVAGGSLAVQMAYEEGFIDDGADYIDWADDPVENIPCNVRDAKIMAYGRLINGLNKIAALDAGGAVATCLFEFWPACGTFGLASAGAWYLTGVAGDRQLALANTPCS